MTSRNERVASLQHDEPAAAPAFQFGKSYEADVSQIALAMPLAQAKKSKAVIQGADLSGKPKIILLVGRGKTGKTTAIRWMSERAIIAGRALLMGDVDPGNLGFSTYFKGVHEPPNRDSPEIAFRWLVEFLGHAIQHKQTAVVDLGGGDTTLRRLADELPGLVNLAEQAGVAIVILYFAGSQIDDLSPIASMAQRAFKPHATALIMNESSVDVGLTREQAFAPIARHPLTRQLMEDGAVPVWMPKLFVADKIELARVHYQQARNGGILGPIDQLRVSAWLDAMEAQWAGILTWLP